MSETGMSNTTKRTVLICEDEPHIRESIRYVVEKAGFDCLLAHDGLEAYDQAKRERPDLIILDVGMPGMNGFDVCEKVRADEALRGIKIVILTAFGQAADEQKSYAVGADEFIVKPFSPRRLQQTLSAMLA